MLEKYTINDEEVFGQSPAVFFTRNRQALREMVPSSIPAAWLLQPEAAVLQGPSLQQRLMGLNFETQIAMQLHARHFESFWGAEQMSSSKVRYLFWCFNLNFSDKEDARCQVTSIKGSAPLLQRSNIQRFLRPTEESPVGIAAGFDKNALLDTWLKLGCGADLRACGSFRRCNFVCCSWGADYMPDFHL